MLLKNVITRVQQYVLRVAFGFERADYYEYLADILSGTDGRKTIGAVFADDQARYGKYSVRSLLSRNWSRTFSQNGGDLAKTFAGSVPDSDLVALRSGQNTGGGALIDALRDLARSTRLQIDLVISMVSAAASASFGLLFAIGSVIAIPLYTVPELRKAFPVPEEYLGGMTRRLYAFSDGLANGALVLSIGLVAMLAVVLWSLNNTGGRARRALDSWSVWRIHRDLHALPFVLTTAAALRTRDTGTMRLREAIEMQRVYASTWLRSHIDDMLARISMGLTGPRTFNTGLLDKKVYHYMEDMILTSDLPTGLQRTADYIEKRVAKNISKRALAFGNRLLLLGVALVLVNAIVHQISQVEMKSAMNRYYQSR